MATAANLQNLDPVLKTLFSQSKIYDMVYKNHPAFGTMNKFEGFGGRNMQIPIQYGHPQGRSATFTFAQQNTTAAAFKAFFLTRRRDYSLAQIDGETADATKAEGPTAFVSAMAVQIDGAMKSLADSHSTAIFRDGTGSIGQVGALATNIITLANIYDVTCFEVGMTLQAAATSGGTPRSGQEVIAGVNRSLGTLQSVDATWATGIAAIAVNDYLLVQGDSNTKMSGFDAWMPSVSPTVGDSFYGVDRSVDTRLSGLIYDASGGDSMEESLINAQSLGAREGGTIDRVWLNPIRLRDLQKGAQAKTMYQRVPVKAQGPGGEVAKISYQGIVIDGDEGPITVMSDPRCPANTGYALTSDTWTLNSIGPAVKMLEGDNLRLLRQSSADGYEVRTGFYGNLGCEAPGFNVRVKYA